MGIKQFEAWFPDSPHKRHGYMSRNDMKRNLKRGSKLLKTKTSAGKSPVEKDREYMSMGIGDIRYRLLMLTVSCWPSSQLLQCTVVQCRIQWSAVDHCHCYCCLWHGEETGKRPEAPARCYTPLYCSTTLYCMLHCCTTLYCTLLHYTVLYCLVHCAALVTALQAKGSLFLPKWMNLRKITNRKNFIALKL